ncbi:hypothetical protein MIND_01429800 [Mycena indigotica]|uniref:Uncharacterized protein n=1 Tax=Mycena indigotica TaxID=2126181 RepID=A0A8H6VQT6_9AGAR|nr:uncharacterized protein MIND_01429800 [Mycena indigotica]KAF7288631.1 hypothetical protein MIND_01429800 [Mycena indigotica]
MALSRGFRQRGVGDAGVGWGETAEVSGSVGALGECVMTPSTFPRLKASQNPALLSHIIQLPRISSPYIALLRRKAGTTSSWMDNDGSESSAREAFAPRSTHPQRLISLPHRTMRLQRHFPSHIERSPLSSSARTPEYSLWPSILSQPASTTSVAISAFSVQTCDPRTIATIPFSRPAGSPNYPRTYTLKQQAPNRGLTAPPSCARTPQPNLGFVIDDDIPLFVTFLTPTVLDSGPWRRSTHDRRN